jgi:hypothetical protein
MKHQKIGPASGADEADVLLGGEPDSYIATAAKSPPTTRVPAIHDTPGESVTDWRAMLVERGYFDRVDVVTGELGPIHVLGSPRVVVAARDGSTWVWVDNQPWGWSDATKEFLRVPSKAANAYALELAGRIREEARQEFERRERIKDARLRDLVAKAAGAR